MPLLDSDLHEVELIDHVGLVDNALLKSSRSQNHAIAVLINKHSVKRLLSRYKQSIVIGAESVVYP